MTRVAIVLVSGLPSAAHAEISDKVAGAPEIILWGLAGALAAFVLARWSRWLSIAGVAGAALFVIGKADLAGINGLREALWSEMPASYFVAIAVSGSLIAAGAVIGAVWRPGRLRRTPPVRPST